MATVDIDTLESRYLDSCERHGILPTNVILSALFKAKVKKARQELISLLVSLDDLPDFHFHPLLDLLSEIDVSEVAAVDLINTSSSVMSGENVLSLLRAVHKKLRVVDVQDILLGKEFLLDLAQRGLTCQVLYLKSSHFRKLNMMGKFMNMHTLNLDFSASLTSFREDCFSCMPNLKFLSLCETRISNLWTTSAALAKLPSLTVLRFQNCLCWDESGKCCTSSRRKVNDNIASSHLDSRLYSEASLANDEEMLYQSTNVGEQGTYLNDLSFDQSTLEYSSDSSEVDFSNHHQDSSLAEFLPDIPSGWDELFDVQNQNSLGIRDVDDGVLLPYSSNSRDISQTASKNRNASHSSPICYEKYYREYMIASLHNLRNLDNLPVEKIDRDRANSVFSQHFEYLPYRRRNKENVASILHKREIRAHHTQAGTPREKLSYLSHLSPSYYSRSLSAAKMGSAWPALHPLSWLGNPLRDERSSFRPRQFEYHPSDSRLMVFGTLDGEVVIVNHESENIVSYIPSPGVMNSVLGLCWLRRCPSKLIAGSDNGSLRLYDINHMLQPSIYHSAGSVIFDDFDQLTSVHVNSTDELLIASGYSKHVALYDICTGRRLQVLADMHREHINVVKFSNHCPSIFATSSFDRNVKMWDLRQKPNQPCYTTSSSHGNVMVCFSPDDQYLLVSAVDNEVKQLLAADGRVHLDFSISSTGSSQNYTRSYYMNGRDYVISGSCDENIVRICCAQTGRRLRDISLEGKGTGASMFVQSLRGDPFRDFNMSILAAYVRPSSNSEIVKVNLLASNESDKLHLCSRFSHPLHGLGG